MTATPEQLAEAVALLAQLEGPGQDVDHARQALSTANMRGDAPEPYQAALDAALAAHVAAGVDQRHIDEAAQLVLDMRAELEPTA